MSRIGKLPVAIPQGVTAAVNGRRVEVKGPKGQLGLTIHERLGAAIDDRAVVVSRRDDERESRAVHGLTRTLVANMVTGVTKGFERTLEINGVGFRAEVQGSTLTMQLGFSHPVKHVLPKGISARVERNTLVTISGIDKELVGQTAATIRAYRRPDVYKGKGVKYTDERLRKKVGKTGAK
jgi:large subunit ribosomal protein L6